MRRPGRWTGIAIAVLLLPFVPVALWATSSSWRYPDLLPTDPTIRGVALVADDRVWQALLTSILIGVLVALIATAIGFSAGRALGTATWRGRRAVQVLLLIPVILPGFAAALGLQVFFLRAGVGDTMWGVILVQLIPTVPYAALLLGAAFEAHDRDLERQARVLGAGSVLTTVRVTLPVLRPAVLTTGALAFIISWSDYLLTLLVGGGQVETLPLLLFSTIGSSDTTAAAALAFLLVLPPVLLIAGAARLWRGTDRAWVWGTV